MPFEIGREYSRLRDIHEVYGGQRRSGIAPSSAYPFIFVFTGKTGENYGYEDGWHEQERVYLYSGEGQVGDMEFTRGNQAIRDHVTDGRQLLLFKALGKSKPVVYMGEFVCASYDFGIGPDRDGSDRRTIRFHLVPADGVAGSLERSILENAQQSEVSTDELRRRAFQAAKSKRNENWRTAKTVQRNRNNDIRAYVLRRAGGLCELTGKPAPFLGRNGEPYLEVHHIHRLSDGGLGHPKNCAAITPNAHREIHYGEHGKGLDDKLADTISAKEASFGSAG